MNRADQQQQPDLELGNIWEPIRNTIKQSAYHTEALYSYGFWIMLAIGAYFHESHFTATISIMGIWFLLQIVSSTFEDDYSEHLLRSISTTVGGVVGYLMAGFVWSAFKMSAIVVHKEFGTTALSHLSNCREIVCENGEFLCAPLEKCLHEFVTEYEFVSHRWVLTWPMNILQALGNYPYIFFSGRIIEWSRNVYVLAIAIALKGGVRITSYWTWGFLIAYPILGYGWTHLKLFLDVWQGALPKKEEERIIGIYERNESYLEFILDIKWKVLGWMLIWPISMVVTGFGLFLPSLADLIYKYSGRTYAKIVGKAMEWRHTKIEEE